jgi:hypothetical protein
MFCMMTLSYACVHGAKICILALEVADTSSVRFHHMN